MSDFDLLVADVLERQVPLRLDRLPVWDDVLARTAVARSPRRVSRKRRRLVLALAMLVLAIIVAGSVWAALGHSPFGGLTWHGESRGDAYTIYVARPSGQIDKLVRANGGPLWSPDGSRALVLEGDYRLHVLRADGSGDVRLPDPGCAGTPNWSPDSRLIGCYAGPDYRLDVVDADGRSTPQTVGRLGSGFSWSPDGNQIVNATTVKGHSMLVLVNTYGTPRRKTIVLRPQPTNSPGAPPFHVSRFRGPLWSPDGSRIAFQWDDGSGAEEWMYVMRPDGTGVTRVGRGWIVSWSPDGRMLAFTRGALRSDSLWVMNADGGGRRRLCEGLDCGGMWLPDSSKLVYFTQRQIFVVNADGSGRTLIARTSRPYDAYSLSPDGKTIAYVGGTGRNRNHNLYIVGVDGSGRKLVAHSSTVSYWGTTWRPVRTH